MYTVPEGVMPLGWSAVSFNVSWAPGEVEALVYGVGAGWPISMSHPHIKNKQSLSKLWKFPVTQTIRAGVVTAHNYSQAGQQVTELEFDKWATGTQRQRLHHLFPGLRVMQVQHPGPLRISAMQDRVFGELAGC